MDNMTFGESLVADGYAILRRCIDQSVIESYQSAITQKLGLMLKKISVVPQDDLYSDFLEAARHIGQYEVQVELSKLLVYEELHKRLFLQPDVLEKLIFVLGSDLEYSSDSDIMVNVKDVQNDYLVKKTHQEFWSGAGINGLQTWTPLAIQTGMGGLEVIEGSHLWGHIPHRDREPVELPGEAVYTHITLDEGDMLLFHSLLLHRTVPNQYEKPRFASSIIVRNFTTGHTGFEDLQNWQSFHYSPLSQIRKRLGNPHLSPFRTYDSRRIQVSRS